MVWFLYYEQAIVIAFVASVMTFQKSRSTAFFLRQQPSQTTRRSPAPLQQYSKNLWSLEDCLKTQTNIQFVDGSWYHKGDRNGREEFLEGPRISNSHYFDMNDIATSKELFPDQNPKGFRTMFPPKSLFAATMDAMGIEKETQVIIYGRRGCWFTPRIWYMFKTYGYSNVGLMQASLEDWVEAGGPIDSEPLKGYNIWAKDLLVTSNYSVPETARLVDKNRVLLEIQDGNRIIVDTRGSTFNKKGHMMGARHIPYASLVEPDNSLRFKSKEELMGILEEKGIPKEESILLSCGSGVSVCHMALVLEECGYPAPLIYDASWNEWGSEPDLPKVVPAGEDVKDR